MADVDIAPNFGLELKVRAEAFAQFNGHDLTNLSYFPGCLQTSQCLGFERGQLAR